MCNDKTVFFVEDQTITFIHISQSAIVVRWDNLSKRMCPVCESTLYYWYCSTCKFRWKNRDVHAVVKHYADPPEPKPFVGFDTIGDMLVHSGKMSQKELDKLQKDDKCYQQNT